MFIQMHWYFVVLKQDESWLFFDIYSIVYVKGRWRYVKEVLYKEA